MKHFIVIFSLSQAFFLPVTTTFAQSANGRIGGTVLDQRHASMPASVSTDQASVMPPPRLEYQQNDCRAVDFGGPHGCNIYVQAGVPYNGRLAATRQCSKYHVEKMEIQASTTIPQHGSQKITNLNWEINQTTLFDGFIYTVNNWTVPGEYEYGVFVREECYDEFHNRNWERANSGVGLVHVLEPQPPYSLMADLNQKYSAGETYQNFGVVFLHGAVQPSGTLVKLTTSQPGIVDIETGQGVTSADTRTAYLWISPTANPRVGIFNVIISATAPVGTSATISASCAGTFSTDGQCGILSKAPLQFTFAVSKKP
jgi:hypothetical protein